MKKGKTVLIAKLKDSYVFDSTSPYSHWYIVRKDPKYNNVHLRELTHLYKPDPYRMAQLRQGLLSKVLLEGFSASSGAEKHELHRNISGDRMTMSDIAKNAVLGIWKKKVIK